MKWRRRRSERVRPDAAQRLPEEAEAFLCGRYREWLETQGCTVPGWAWINVLAHGTLDDLVGIAEQGRCDDGPESLVAELSAGFLALLNKTGTGLQLLQQSSLIPLESRMQELFGSHAPRDRGQFARWLAAAVSQSLGSTSWLSQ